MKRKKHLGNPFVAYTEPFVKWTTEDLTQSNQETRKLMTIHKAMHPRDDIHKLYLSSKRTH